MHLWRLKPAACTAFVLLASCTSGGSGGAAGQQAATLERFADIPSLQVSVDPAGVVHATVPQGPPTQGPTQQAALLYDVSAQGQAKSTSVSMVNPGGLASDAAGNVYFTETRSCVTHFCDADSKGVAADGTVTRIAGVGDTIDGQPGTIGTLAGIAVDAQGSIYIVDFNRIRKLARDGTQSTFAGDPLRCAEVDGKGALASFCGPQGLAVDALGNVFVADRAGDTIRRITPEGDVTTIAGVPMVAGSADGPASSATFDRPSQVAVDANGNVYVADTGNALIREISASGMVTTLAGTRGAQGFTPGPLPGVLDPPGSIALHGSDLYIAMPTAIGRITNLH